MAAPGLVLGPGYVLDDWFALADARFDGWWMAAGHDQWLARPGVGVAYAVQFGLVGPHPLVAYLVNVVLMAAATVLLRSLLLRVGAISDVAMAVPAVWLVLPNHGSLLFWPSAGNIALSLVLLLAGLRALAGGGAGAFRWPLPAWWGRSGGPSGHRKGHVNAVGGALMLAASVLCYEATAPAALVGAAVVPALAGRPWRRPLVTAAVVLSPVAAWMIVFFHPAKRHVHASADLRLVVPAHLGWGVFPAGGAATALGAAACAATALVLVRAVRRHEVDPDAALVLAGLAVVGLGTLPFVRYFYAPLGAGDRVNVVAGVGTALLWTGLGVAALQVLDRRLVAGGAAVVLGMMAAADVQAASAWHRAGADARRLLAAPAVAAATPGEDVAVPRPPVRRNVAAFLDLSNVSSAVQLRAGTRRVTAHLTPPPAPPPSDP